METSNIERDEICIETFPVGSLQCNCSLIYHKETRECLIVDPGNDAQTLMTLIRERNLKVVKLLHTHAHFDHIGESSEIKRQTQAKMYLHQGDDFLFELLQEQGLFFGQKVGKQEKIDEPLHHQQSFDVGTHFNISTMHTPGHTPGSCCFYTEFFDHPILLSGDTLFKRSIGRTDLPGGDMDTILKSIKRELMILPEETLIVPGHGPKTRLVEEKANNPFLQG